VWSSLKVFIRQGAWGALRLFKGSAPGDPRGGVRGLGGRGKGSPEALRPPHSHSDCPFCPMPPQKPRSRVTRPKKWLKTAVSRKWRQSRISARTVRACVQPPPENRRKSAVLSPCDATPGCLGWHRASGAGFGALGAICERKKKGHLPPPDKKGAGAWDNAGERASDEGGPLRQYRL
jgi:hypothetical protein